MSRSPKTCESAVIDFYAGLDVVTETISAIEGELSRESIESRTKFSHLSQTDHHRFTRQSCQSCQQQHRTASRCIVSLYCVAVLCRYIVSLYCVAILSCLCLAMPPFGDARCAVFSVCRFWSGNFHLHIRSNDPHGVRVRANFGFWIIHPDSIFHTKLPGVPRADHVTALKIP